MLNQKEIYRLIKEGEGESLDFKQGINSKEKIAKTLSAFANTKGGYLLIGVKDNGKILGVDPMEEKEMLEWTTDSFTKPVVPIDYEIIEVEGKSILAAYIKESNQKPHFALDENKRKWAYIRSKDQTLLASIVLLDVMKKDSMNEDKQIHFGEAEKQLLEYLEKHSQITMKEFCRLCKLPRKIAVKILVNLIRMKIIKVSVQEKTDYYTL